MGNLLSTNKNHSNIYEPFINQHATFPENIIYLAEQVQQLSENNRLLEEEIKLLKRELVSWTSRMDASIQIKYNEFNNSLAYYNEQNNEKIGIITKDMENLLNNDKILLDKLIEKNIVSTIQDT